MGNNSFQEVIKQFNRMCWYYKRKNECPMGCPMSGVNISQCRKIIIDNPYISEKTIMDWAKEHPNPVYPTWFNWVKQQGVVAEEVNLDNISFIVKTGQCDQPILNVIVTREESI